MKRGCALLATLWQSLRKEGGILRGQREPGCEESRPLKGRHERCVRGSLSEKTPRDMGLRLRDVGEGSGVPGPKSRGFFSPRTPNSTLSGKLLTICKCFTNALNLIFLGGSAGKESTCNAGDLGLIPGLGRSPGEGNGYPLQDSGLENSTACIVYGIAESQT